MFNIHVIIILIRSIFHALDKYPIHQIQFRVLLKISQDACYAGTVRLTTTTLPDKTSCHCAVSTAAGLGTGTSIIVPVATFLLGAFVATVVTLIVFR